jgi:hypothetical protein
MDIILEDAVNEFTKVYMQDIGERERESLICCVYVSLIFLFFLSQEARVVLKTNVKTKGTPGFVFTEREDVTKRDMSQWENLHAQGIACGNRCFF